MSLKYPGVYIEEVPSSTGGIRGVGRAELAKWKLEGGPGRAGRKMLFHGAPGTGKKATARGLASELSAPVIRIDLSQVLSKYIGETEKNLSRILELAEERGAVLLFDEADALFGKRTEVQDSGDCYANQEVGYLLQLLERFEGTAILTTKSKSNIDTAFLRRFHNVVEFPHPD